MKLLADTGALIALFHPRDALHQQATRFVKEAAGTRFVVTEPILSDTVTRLRARVEGPKVEPAHWREQTRGLQRLRFRLPEFLVEAGAGAVFVLSGKIPVKSQARHEA